ncbi:MAG TPA: amino acid adenylation domain-containing protein, partial [Pyrinomonadaceae bacterium]
LMDGRARLTLFKELFALYEAYLRGEDFEPDEPRPFRDYVEWMKGFDLSAAEEFWRPRLKGLAGPTSLARPWHVAREPHEYGELEASLSEADTSALRSLAKQNGLTLNTIVQGAWALLLSRYSGEEDVVFGATWTCRRNSVPGAEGIVGLLINTIPMRLRVPQGAPLLPWLKELRAENVALRGYEHTPLLKIQEWSGLPGGVPLFENLLVFENYRMNTELRSQGGSWGGREFRVVERTNYPLTVSAYAYPQLTFKVSYDRQYFDHNAITRLTGHLLTLLEGIASDPDRRLSDLPMLTPAELREILSEWNETAQEYPSESCLHELFEQRAAESPAAPALFHEGGEVSYGELNERANRLAHLLRQRGVGPESRVGVLLPRTPELVISLLAILKAGGAYVPLDPRYPQERLRFMLEDSGADIILTEGSLLESLPGLGGRALCLDTQREEVSRHACDNPARTTVPESLAYVIYTSGSTGRPKGVAIAHRNAVALVSWARSRYTAEELSGVLASTSVCFDLSVFELFAPLTSGGAAVLADDALALCGLKSAARVRLVNTVPSAAAELLRLGCLPASAKTVNLAGEPLATSLVRRLYEEAGVGKVYDLYGPTEDTTYSTCALREAEGAATVGRPLANRRAYILDAGMRPVPVGVEGEVYLGGAGVTRGYLNRPAQTAERYVPDPFSTEPGGRLYRTGDVARYLNDGRIVYVGRRDRQVKVRGFRIELGEIENVLSKHPAVREGVVAAWDDGDGKKRLAAYVVSNGGGRPSAAELREHLRASLPEYMVPSSFTPLEALPLTPNGKVDRRRLPAPEPAHAETEDAYVEPRTAVEEVVAGIWKHVLKVERVGVRDNFFDLGGHSLLATSVVSRVAESLRVNVPLRSMFEAPTVEQFCRAVVEREAKPGQTEKIADILKRVQSMEGAAVLEALRER